jgi:hypothetical protein
MKIISIIVLIGIFTLTGCAVSVRVDEDSFSFNYRKLVGEEYE